MGDFIEPGTHRSTNIKVKIETQQKNQKCFFAIALNPKILYMRKKNRQEGYTKMHKISGNLTFQS